MAFKFKFKFGLGRSDSLQSSSMKDRLINPLKSDRIGKIKSSLEKNILQNPTIPHTDKIQVVRNIKRLIEIRIIGKKIGKKIEGANNTIPEEATVIIKQELGTKPASTKEEENMQIQMPVEEKKEIPQVLKKIEKTKQEILAPKITSTQAKSKIKCKDCSVDITGTKWATGGFCEECLKKSREEIIHETKVLICPVCGSRDIE